MRLSFRGLGLATVLATAACASAPQSAPVPTGPAAPAAPAPAIAAHAPPAASKALLSGIDFSAARPVSEDYRSQFVTCDGDAAAGAGKDTFRGHSTRRPNRPENEQYYLCSRDPSRVKALLKLADGAVYWESKMALDVDGSWAAWNGVPGTTDLKQTWMQWSNVANKASQEAQVDPDVFPFIVMPMNGLSSITGTASKQLGEEFAKTTGLGKGDMGVVVYNGRWTPVFVGDGGPFMRLGEGSSRVFESIGESRCRGWNADRTDCIGTTPGAYPYRNAGLSRDVVFIVYPGSAKADMTAATALATICAFARTKLGLTGSASCPAS